MSQPVVRATLSAVVLCAFAAGSAAAADARRAPFDREAVTAAARTMAVGDRLLVDGVQLEFGAESPAAGLELERFEVFAPDAKIVVHTIDGEKLLPVPANVYLRGRIVGDPLSLVTLSVLESGEIRGIATSTGRSWLVGAAAGQGHLELRSADEANKIGEPGGGFRCEVDHLDAGACGADLDAEATQLGASLVGVAREGIAAKAQPHRPTNSLLGIFDHTAVIAIETDNEFLALGPIGGNTTTATNYIADLVAFSSTIYTASLWAVADPYAQTGGCGLLELGRHWNLNNTGVDRTVAHFLSGKNSNSGIAWVGVLCSGAFNASPATVGATCAAPVSGNGSYGGDYGFTAGIDANFDLDSPSVVWDILAFTHEIGHNFNSPHTHCYQNVGGNAAAVDNCSAGQCGTNNCYCGATSLPSGCPGSGSGCGTIMSYCHLLGGGMGNITMTLGLGHPFGIAPARVPNRMRTHVESIAASNPTCLAPLGNDPIFADGFESGNTSAWTEFP
jgi:hypothetical protein